MAYKQFLFTTFDGDVAQFYGVPTGWVEAMFSLVLAGTIVVSLQVLGVLLIAGATVIPRVSARMLTDSFPRMLLLSTGIGLRVRGDLSELFRGCVFRGDHSLGGSGSFCSRDGLLQRKIAAGVGEAEGITHLSRCAGARLYHPAGRRAGQDRGRLTGTALSQNDRRRVSESGCGIKET